MNKPIKAQNSLSNSLQSVAINISSQCEFPLTSVHFSVCKKINYFISVHAIEIRNILVERKITGAIYTTIS